MTSLPSPTRRQAVGAVVIALLWAGIILAVTTGHPNLATILLAGLMTVVLAAVALVARRLTVIRRADRAVAKELRTRVDQLQRRLVAAAETERLVAGDRHRELTDAVTEVRGLVQQGAAAVQRSVPREFEALVQLFQDFTPRAPMPSCSGFAMDPTGLLELVHLVRARRPRLVLELGSGTSSVWIAYALEQIGGRLVSIDHDHGYAERTRAQLTTHGLAAVAEVRHAPLKTVTAAGRTVQWYDPAGFADLGDVDLLLIDGPPQATGPDARYPALPMLAARLAATATVICDDASRPEERAAVRNWIETIPGLTREPALLGRHAVLSYVRAPRSLASVPA